MEPPYTTEDVELALRIFQRAIEHFKIPDESTLGSVKEYLREDGTIDFDRTPIVTVRKWENGVPFLNMVFFYGGNLTVLAEYNPLVSILDFIGEARRMFDSRYPFWTDEKRQASTEHEAFYMTVTLLSRIYPRMNLAMQNFVSEVIQAWDIRWRKFEARVASEVGIKPLAVSETKIFRSLLKEYSDDLLKLWLNSPDKRSEDKKKQFAQEYQSILKHWRKLREWCRKGDMDWREYAKPGKFSDTPDDLLDKLEDSEAGQTSHFALEHAARRAGLFKVTRDDKILKKRAQQIEVTGYTPRQLLTFLNEGEKLLGEMHAQSELHQKEETDEADEIS